MSALTPVSGILADITGGTLTYADATQVMVSAQKLSIETGADLGDSTRAIAEAMRTFNLTAADSAQIEQLVYEGMRVTGEGATEYATALDMLHARLAPFNVDMQTNAVLLNDSARAGADGGRQMMQLATSLDNLLKPTAAQRQELYNLNVSLYDTAGAVLPLPTIMDELGQALSKLSPQEQIAAEQALFGATGYTKLYEIMASGKTVSEQVSAQLIQQALHTNDAAVAADTATASFDKLKASAANLGTELGVHLNNEILNTLNLWKEMGSDVGSSGFADLLENLGSKIESFLDGPGGKFLFWVADIASGGKLDAAKAAWDSFVHDWNTDPFQNEKTKANAGDAAAAVAKAAETIMGGAAASPDKAAPGLTDTAALTKSLSASYQELGTVAAPSFASATAAVGTLENSQRSLNDTVAQQSLGLQALIAHLAELQHAGQGNSAEAATLASSIDSESKSLQGNIDKLTENQAALTDLKRLLGDTAFAHADLVDKLKLSAADIETTNDKWRDTIALLGNIDTSAAEAGEAVANIFSKPSKEELSLTAQLDAVKLKIDQIKASGAGEGIGPLGLNTGLSGLEQQQSRLTDQLGAARDWRQTQADSLAALSPNSLTEAQMGAVAKAAASSPAMTRATVAGPSMSEAWASMVAETKAAGAAPTAITTPVINAGSVNVIGGGLPIPAGATLPTSQAPAPSGVAPYMPPGGSTAPAAPSHPTPSGNAPTVPPAALPGPGDTSAGPMGPSGAPPAGGQLAPGGLYPSGTPGATLTPPGYPGVAPATPPTPSTAPAAPPSATPSGNAAPSAPSSGVPDFISGGSTGFGPPLAPIDTSASGLRGIGMYGAPTPAGGLPALQSALPPGGAASTPSPAPAVPPAAPPDTSSAGGGQIPGNPFKLGDPPPTVDVTANEYGPDTVKKLWPLAQWGEAQTGIPADVLLAQNASEASILGNSQGGIPSSLDLFGLKGSGPAGQSSQGTWEGNTGSRVGQEGNFSNYTPGKAATESYVDFINFYSDQKRAGGGQNTLYGSTWSALQASRNPQPGGLGDWQTWMQGVTDAGANTTDQALGHGAYVSSETALAARIDATLAGLGITPGSSSGGTGTDLNPSSSAAGGVQLDLARSGPPPINWNTVLGGSGVLPSPTPRYGVTPDGDSAIWGPNGRIMSAGPVGSAADNGYVLPAGTPISSPISGTVSSLAPGISGAPTAVEITRASDGLVVALAHLSDIMVQQGDKVTTGQQVGRVSSNPADSLANMPVLGIAANAPWLPASPGGWNVDPNNINEQPVMPDATVPLQDRIATVRPNTITPGAGGGGASGPSSVPVMAAGKQIGVLTLDADALALVLGTAQENATRLRSSAAGGLS